MASLGSSKSKENGLGVVKEWGGVQGGRRMALTERGGPLKCTSECGVLAEEMAS